MPARTIENPGVEINEIDRSGYEKVDNSLPNSPVCFVTGVADKGQDMTFEWIDSKATLDDTFGSPTTEFEAYMYNAVMEILNRGGTCIASKLPYDNAQRDMYNCIDFDISQLVVLNDLNIDVDYITVGNIRDSLDEVIRQLKIRNLDLSTVGKMASAVKYLYNAYLGNDVVLSTIRQIAWRLKEFIQRSASSDVMKLMTYNDSDLTSYINIRVKQVNADGNQYGSKSSIEDLDDLTTSRNAVPLGTMRVYDITRSQYQTVNNYNCVSCVSEDAYTNECLGIVPVVVTPANAMYFQRLIDLDETIMPNAQFEAFNPLSGYATQHNTDIVQDFADVNQHISIPIASSSQLADMNLYDIDSVSRIASNCFPPITFYNAEHFDKTNLKKIGIVVLKTFRDTSNSGKIGFQLLESFVGSLDRNAHDEITHASIFIDNVVNQRSQFIRLFSHVDPYTFQQAATISTSRQPAVALGFYKTDCAKNISYMNTVMNPLTKILDNASNRNLIPIDIIADAGMSTIAQLAKMSSIVQAGALPQDIEKYRDLTVLHTDALPFISDYKWTFNQSQHDISGWRSFVMKLDTFCKSTRKDCLFIADGLRAVCLEGNAKIVRPTAPQNTVSNTIIPNFRQIAHIIDSSYSCGYCNWYYQQDYSGFEDYIWIPPSIKAMGVCIYCDTYFHPWNAPAGLTRGILGDVVDVAFLPTDNDAGVIYSNSWNYAMSYPMDGIVVEGHKTFQTQRTALDRINVRRLMLHLEKQVEAVARTFVYEQNTAYTRQQFVDTIEPILDAAVAGDGVIDYAIKCDEELNTPQVIENNEMRCKIAVKPVKCVDYLVLTFICSNQSADVTEEVMR